MPRHVATVRWLARLISPGAWLLLAAWGLTQVEPARLTLAPYARFFCFAALAAAGLLSWYYSQGDRKSTRLNSSHLVISYAVFCLKKKKQYRERLLLREIIGADPIQHLIIHSRFLGEVILQIAHDED